MPAKVKPETIQDVLVRLREMVKAGHGDEVRAHLDEYQRAYDDLDFFRMIRGLYSDLPLLTVGPWEYASVVFPAPEDQIENPDSILVGPPSRTVPKITRVSDYHKMMLALTSHEEHPIYDGRVYVLDGPIRIRPLKVPCGVGSFFEMLDTSAVLEFEAKLAWHQHADQMRRRLKTPEAYLPFLSQRARLHRNVETPALVGIGRAASISVAALICYRSSDGSYRSLLVQRAREGVPQDRGGWCLIPSAEFELSNLEEPGVSDPLSTYSIVECVLREYVEELFGKSAPKGNLNPKWYRQEEECIYLERLLERGLAGIYLAGLTIDLMNLRPEVATLLIIHDPAYESKWMRKPHILNWEYERSPTAARMARRIPIRDDAFLLENYELSPRDMVVSTSGSFWLAKRLAERVLGGEIGRTRGPIAHQAAHSQGEARSVQRVFMKRLAGGKVDIGTPEGYSPDEIDALLKEQRHGIVVDERAWELSIGEKRLSILKMKPMQAGMLWLVFRRVGDRITDRDVRQTFGIKSRAQELHAYRHSLKAVLGKSLDDIVIPRKRLVPLTGWSFCWIRLEQDERRSRLLAWVNQDGEEDRNVQGH